MKKYLCINCKEEFDEIPEVIHNECRAGYFHTLIKSLDIIDRRIKSQMEKDK